MRFVPGDPENHLPPPRPRGARPKVLTNRAGSHRFAETTLGFDKADNALQTFALPEIGHHKWPFATHPSGVRVHFLQRCADIGRKVDLVDDEKVRPGDARTSLGRDLV